MKKPAFSSRWSKYKRWCLEALHHPFGASFRSQINYESVLAQVMEYLSYFKASCTSNSSFSDMKAMLAWVYKSVFAYKFGTDVRIMQWMKGWQHEKPKSVKFDTDTDGWDVGLIVDYWSRQPPNAELTTVELGYKAPSLFAIAVYPRPSDLARLSRDQFERLAYGIRYRYFACSHTCTHLLTCVRAHTRTHNARAKTHRQNSFCTFQSVAFDHTASRRQGWRSI